MPPDLPLQHNFSLRSLNTFGIDARAQCYLRAESVAHVRAALADPALAALPRLVLGGGSNIVLRGDFPGLVLHMALRGRDVVAGDDADGDGDQHGHDGEAMHYVRAAAGESWHGFVEWTIAQGFGGLENLALIPGTVGAAPIQNIGAYGVELTDYFHCLSALDPVSGAVVHMDKAACRFGYRDSAFKHGGARGLVILDVTFALPKRWQPRLQYAELAQALPAGGAAPTPRQIADGVIAIRRRKLPDPQVIGNAGSFFKNPIVSRAQCQALLARHPALVHHAQPDGSEKLAAGWLIDQCGWKGRRLGPAGVYERQALVLVNHGGASGGEVMQLAAAIQADVAARYGVHLEPEPVLV